MQKNKTKKSTYKIIHWKVSSVFIGGVETEARFGLNAVSSVTEVIPLSPSVPAPVISPPVQLQLTSPSHRER